MIFDILSSIFQKNLSTNFILEKEGNRIYFIKMHLIESHGKSQFVSILHGPAKYVDLSFYQIADVFANSAYKKLFAKGI